MATPTRGKLLAKQTLLVAFTMSFTPEGLEHGVHAKISGSQSSLCDGNSESRLSLFRGPLPLLDPPLPGRTPFGGALGGGGGFGF